MARYDAKRKAQTLGMGFVVCLSLSGCGAALVPLVDAISVAAAASTLLKNEADCSLAQVTACKLPSK